MGGMKKRREECHYDDSKLEVSQKSMSPTHHYQEDIKGKCDHLIQVALRASGLYITKIKHVQKYLPSTLFSPQSRFLSMDCENLVAIYVINVETLFNVVFCIPFCNEANVFL